MDRRKAPLQRARQTVTEREARTAHLWVRRRRVVGETLPDDSAGIAAGLAAALPADSVEQPGQLIGRYKLLQQIGEGGFGTVWMPPTGGAVEIKGETEYVHPTADTDGDGHGDSEELNTLGTSPVLHNGISYRVINGSEIQITGCDPSVLGNIVIPSVIDGKPVTIIREKAFRGCSGLTSVTIPSSVGGIWTAAFDVCTSLTSVTFESPSSVDYIGCCAFSDCTSLTSITPFAPPSGPAQRLPQGPPSKSKLLAAQRARV